MPATIPSTMPMSDAAVPSPARSARFALFVSRWTRRVVATALLVASPFALADPEAGRMIVTQVCAACHGADGNPLTDAFPMLAGQSARYIYLQLKDFKEGRRSDPQMTGFAQGLERQQMLDIGEFLAAQAPRPLPFKADPARAERGRKKAEETLCTMCHLGGFKGQNEIPRVAGQAPAYVIKQLTAFKARTRTNDAGNMTSVAQTLDEESIKDLAHFLSTL
jgi:cytochrome c553